MTMTQEEYKAQLAQLQEKQRINLARMNRCDSKIKALISDEHRLFEKKRAHFLIQIGAEWCRLMERKLIEDDFQDNENTYFEEILQRELDRMKVIAKFYRQDYL